METTTISLSRILQLRVPVAWQEAVAIAQAVADCVGSGTTAGSDTCVLTVTGRVAVEGVSRHPYDADPAVHVLELLLDRAQTPKELTALIARHQAEDSRNPSGFARDLAFFARPDSSSDISAVVNRALVMEQEAGTQAELERLRQVATPVVVPPPSKTSTRSVRPWVIGIGSLAAAAALFVVIGSMPVSSAATETLVTSGNETPAQPTAVEKITTSLGKVVDAGLSSLGLVPAATAPAAAVPPAPPARKAALPRARSPQLVVRGGAPVLVAAAEAPARSEASAAPAETLTVYAENPVADVLTEVQPPVLVRPQLRTESLDPDVTPTTAYLELIVNEFGRVDRVQLHATHSTLHDRMLLSAAKAWVFSPARQNGQPVKYVMRVPLTPEPQP